MSVTLDQYFPFATGAGSNVSEAQWREMFETIMGDGVVDASISALNTLAVSQRAAGANMSVDVATGWMWIRGEFGVLASIANIGIAANGTGNPRVDLIVARADLVNKTMVIDVVQGTAAAAAAEPALTQTASTWEIPLAAVQVISGAVSIATADCGDRRNTLRTQQNDPWKRAVRFATTAALAASTITGNTRVANANGALGAVDGVTGVTGDRLLDKDHATGSARGIWRIVDPGTAARPWRMERPPDFDASAKVVANTVVMVSEGTTLADSSWQITTNDPITLGSTSLTFGRLVPAVLASPVSNTTATDESTTSTGYVAPTTARSVTITPVGTRIAVTLVAKIYSDGNTGAFASIDVSGGVTSTANDARCIQHTSAAGSQPMRAALYQEYTVTPGVATTVAVQIKTDSAPNAAHISNQYLLVEEKAA